MKKLLIISLLIFSVNGWTGNSDYQCINAKNELSSAERVLRQAKNYYNINSISCNNVGGTCMRPMPRMCSNQVMSCNRNSPNYSSCASRANNNYRSCVSNANRAADNQQRACRANADRAKNSCRNNVRSQANSRISQANNRLANARSRVSNYCD